MDGILAIAAMLVLLAPLHFRVIYLLNRMDPPEYLRAAGVSILRQEALDSCAEIIGACSGAANHRSVTFKCMEYEFASVVPPRYQARIDANGLYLDPGLLYLFCRFAPSHAMDAHSSSEGTPDFVVSAAMQRLVPQHERISMPRFSIPHPRIRTPPAGA